MRVPLTRRYRGRRRRPAPNPRFRRSRRRPKRGQRGPRVLGTPVECLPCPAGVSRAWVARSPPRREHEMTAQRSFKRLVRARMDKTGESYTAARQPSCAGAEETGPRREAPRSSTRTPRSASAPGEDGRSGSTSSTSGARPTRSHREIAQWVASSWASSRWAGTPRRSPAATSAPGVGREVGQKPDGFRVTATKTVAVPVEPLYEAFVDPIERKRWLPDIELRKRTATAPKSARFDWNGGPSRLHVTFDAKDPQKSTAIAEPRAARRRRRTRPDEGVLARTNRAT